MSPPRPNLRKLHTCPFDSKPNYSDVCIFTDLSRTAIAKRQELSRSVPVRVYRTPAGMIPLKRILFQLDENGDLSLRALDVALETTGNKVSRVSRLYKYASDHVIFLGH
jgi:hypothetical protein